MTHARTKYVVLFWWFLLYTPNYAVRVGPFYDVSECDAIRAQIPDELTITSCWSDMLAPRNTLRK